MTDKPNRYFDNKDYDEEQFKADMKAKKDAWRKERDRRKKEAEDKKSQTKDEKDSTTDEKDPMTDEKDSTTDEKSGVNGDLTSASSAKTGDCQAPDTPSVHIESAFSRQSEEYDFAEQPDVPSESDEGVSGVRQERREQSKKTHHTGRDFSHLVEAGRATRFRADDPKHKEKAIAGGSVTKQQRAERVLGKELAKMGYTVDGTLGALFAKVVALAMDKDTELKDVVKAVRLVAEYTVGKPVDRVEVKQELPRIVIIDPTEEADFSVKDYSDESEELIR